ncbi:hypothetical protein [Paenibacillus sp. N3.4]|uniref:hypothetical protein n=1 Tax=Paenibacillus sp. N3.4 TaxID=2603222 RepID=UPI0011CBD1DA|nr:hypothetical protein [Paenibacillus sp. N3.4]TXK75124.1 hypothetical protein FU659_27855 [Paenibacillus sp. N3.4]
MITYTHPISQTWINDHLDLYNYALALGDKEWQQQILQTLGQFEHHLTKKTTHWLSYQKPSFSVFKRNQPST